MRNSLRKKVEGSNTYESIKQTKLMAHRRQRREAHGRLRSNVVAKLGVDVEGI